MTDNRFECPNCGWVSYPPAHVLVVFHPCKPARSRTPLRRRLPPVKATREEILADDRAAWARDRMGPVAESLEDALGDAALRGAD